MIVAVDAMGGDYAPREIVKGAVAAAKNGIADIILVGDKGKLERELAELGSHDGIEIVHTEQVIAMDEQPALAIRRKRDASIVVATKLVKEGRAAAVVSAGSTGAQMATALLVLGRIGHIQRPAIAAVLPSNKGPKVLLDVGTNVDCRPEFLYEFALMGSIYAQRVLEIENPRVGLLNIGAEDNKGNELTIEAFKLLQTAPVIFAGNVEGRDILTGEADVIVCDGFLGNVLLKFAEGLAQALFTMIKAEVDKGLRTKVGAALTLPAFKSVKKQMDYTEYGGVPLLGVRGISIICHGSSDARTIMNAVRVAVKCEEQELVRSLEQLSGNGGEGKNNCCQPR